jgi:hypothetical protein
MKTSFQDDFDREVERQAREAIGVTEFQIDAYIEAILTAAGSSLRHYMPYSKDALRKAMLGVLQSHLALLTNKGEQR